MTRALPYMGALVEIHVNSEPVNAMFTAPPGVFVQMSLPPDSGGEVVDFQTPSR